MHLVSSTMVLSEPTVDDPEEPISGARLDPHGRMPLRLRSPLFKHAVLHVQVMLRCSFRSWVCDTIVTAYDHVVCSRIVSPAVICTSSSRAWALWQTPLTMSRSLKPFPVMIAECMFLQAWIFSLSSSSQSAGSCVCTKSTSRAEPAVTGFVFL